MLAGWRRCHTSLATFALRSCHGGYAAGYSTSSSPPPSTPSSSSSNGLRQLMRKVAQPVAVITANLHHAEKLNEPDHGATISSFVSIALHPTPLVAFALRLPSRLATFLNAHREASSSSSTSSSLSSSSSDHQFPTFKIHLLSEEQEDIARAFARQLPLPNKAMPSSSSPPPSSSSSSHLAPFPRELFQKLEETTLGSLECILAGDLPLIEPLFQSSQTHHTIDAFNKEQENDQNDQVEKSKIGSKATSQLFIAKVVNVNEGSDMTRHPLLYYHQKYCVLDME